MATAVRPLIGSAGFELTLYARQLMDVAKAAADRRAVQRIERQLLGRVGGKSCAHMVVPVARPPAIFEAESGARGDVVDPAAQRTGVEIFFARHCGRDRKSGVWGKSV